MAGRQLQRWDHVVHEDILIALFQHVTLAAGDWANIMADMRAKGYVFTEGALRYGPVCCVSPASALRAGDGPFLRCAGRQGPFSWRRVALGSPPSTYTLPFPASPTPSASAAFIVHPPPITTRHPHAIILPLP